MPNLAGRIAIIGASAITIATTAALAGMLAAVPAMAHPQSVTVVRTVRVPARPVRVVVPRPVVAAPIAPPRHGAVVVKGNAGTVVIDRSYPRWWVGHTGFVAYVGPRPGYYYAPGYGYYRIPVGWVGRPFVVGVVLPAPLRRYPIVTPAIYGLRPAPVGYTWFYAGSSFVLASGTSGVIVQSVVGGW